MDSDSIGDRLKKIEPNKDDIASCAVESEEEVPKILSPEINDVFHVFVNMLDAKSFLNLAKTSEKMYKRCTEDKQIRINVEANILSPDCNRVFVKFHSYYDFDLRNLPCKVNITVNQLEISKPLQPEVLSDMKEIGVKKIHEICVRNDSVDWEAVIAMVKDFDVQSLRIYQPIEAHVLRECSILELNLEELHFHNSLPVEMLLELDSPIREIDCFEIENISKNQFMDICAKIQSGSLRRLTASIDVNWDDYDALSIDHEGPLPDQRPLIISGIPPGGWDPADYWLLHWHGGVTKITILFGRWEIYKCEPSEYPYILRKDEEILKDLAEKRPRISCSKEQFHSFVSSLHPIYNWWNDEPISEARPAYFDADNLLWMLDEEDNLMKCTWEDGVATWNEMDQGFHRHNRIGNTHLEKYLFWKLLKQAKTSTSFELFCATPFDFNLWLDDGNKVFCFDYWGDVPTERPLIFEMPSSEVEKKDIRIVLLDEEKLLKCTFTEEKGIKVESCDLVDRPPTLFAAEHIVELLTLGRWWDGRQTLGDLDSHWPSKYPKNSKTINCRFDTFRDSLERLRQKKNLIVAEKTETQFWYLYSFCAWKVDWKEERICISRGDVRGSPFDFAEKAFRDYTECPAEDSLKLDCNTFRSCLEQFTVLSFDHSGPLPSENPLVFVKSDVLHNCRVRDECRCSDISPVSAWFIWEDRLDGMPTKCSLEWKPSEPWEEVHFTNRSDKVLKELPPVLKSKEHLETILQAHYDKWSRYKWYGSRSEFLSHLNDYVMLPFNHYGPMPKERPLLFKTNTWHNRIDEYYWSLDEEERMPVYFVLRKDGTVIACAVEDGVSCYSDCLIYYLPPALKKMF